MNSKNIFCFLRKSTKVGFLLIIPAIISCKNLYAQVILPEGQASPPDGRVNWYVNTSLQLAGGNFIYNSYSNIFSFYGGIGYQNNNFGISFSIPVVGNQNNFVSQAGGMMLPIGNPNSNSSSPGGGGMMGSRNPMSGSRSPAGMNWGIGDLYLFSNYQLLSESDFFSDVTINAQVKFPTASTHMGIGTGQFDYGASFTFRKSLDTFVAIADLGYLNIGDPSGATYENPFTYAFGLGKFFNDGEYSLLLFYSAYTEVVKGYESPKQISLGLNYNISENLIFTGIGSAGLSKFTPAYTFSAGMRFGI